MTPLAYVDIDSRSPDNLIETMQKTGCLHWIAELIDENGS